MTIIERIEDALGAVLPVYGSGVDFSYVKEPDRYAIYSLNEVSTDWGDGKPHSTTYNITVNVFSECFDLHLYSEIKRSMLRAGFTPRYGGEISTTKYLSVTQYYLEFSGVETFE